MIVYERLLDADLDRALREGSAYFARASAVHKTLRKLVARLDGLGIEYALTGVLAMFLHGYRQFTENVNVIVSREGLERIHDELGERGYVVPVTGRKYLRDEEFGVRIEFHVAGTFPGDGKPQPVSFLEPCEASVVIDEVRVLSLEKLVELKLASGMTDRLGRLKDLGDVQSMLRVLKLPRDFAERLHPFVREKFVEFQQAIEANPDPHEQGG